MVKNQILIIFKEKFSGKYFCLHSFWDKKVDKVDISKLKYK